MATFLNTTGVSYHLEELIKNTSERLILISPYLQFNERIKEHLKNLNVRKKDIRIIYRENKLQVDEQNWLEAQVGIRTSICKNLHAKCYLNEREAIITSMNLYEFSQQNNNEMGIIVSKSDDEVLYTATLREAQRLLTISEEIRVSVKKVSSESKHNNTKQVDYSTSAQFNPGFCIRTGISIPFNVEKPMSDNAFRSWSKFGDPEYPEKYCHFSGEDSNGETCYIKPVLRKNWKKVQSYSPF